jgi:hypothetical protein
VFDTRLEADGPWDLRIEVWDRLGLRGEDIITVMLDNQPPFASVTSPVAIDPAVGGLIYTLDGKASLLVGANAFSTSVSCTLEVLNDDASGDAPEAGVVPLTPKYRASWGSAQIRKAAILSIGWSPGRSDGPGVQPAIVRVDGANREVLGGTLSTDRSRLTTSTDRPGVYEVAVDSLPPTRDGALATLNVMPRVIAAGDAAPLAHIRFRLGAPATVAVRIYSRAGRLMKSVATDLQLAAGENVLTWNGRNDEGDMVPDGAYVVSVKAGGAHMTQVIAVVR